MKLITIYCLVLMLLGATLGAVLWQTWQAAVGFSLIGLGCATTAMWLLGVKPEGQ